MRASYVIRHNDHLVIGNDKIEGTISLRGEEGLAALTNKITGTEIRLTNATECALRLATNGHRAYIPEWSFHVGSGEAVPHEEDSGFREGFYRPEFDDSTWSGVQRINDFPLGGPGYSPVVYPGYGWYRCTVELPVEVEGQPVEFGLGGYDHQDWEQYWVYLNGVPIGHASPEGMWHEAPKFVLHPDDPRYASFRFGAPNVVAVQTRGLDRTTPDMVVSDCERYSIGSFLVDQYVSAGPVMREAAALRFVGCTERSEGAKAYARLEYANEAEGWSVAVTYWIDGDEATLYKQVEVRNTGGTEQVLLEIDLHRFAVDAEVSTGGVGLPCTIGGEWFGAIRHPAGINRGERGALCLTMLPGIRLAPGAQYVGKVVMFGAGPAGQAGQSFVQHLEKYSPRNRELLTIYNCYGIHDLAGIDEPTYMTEELVMNNLDDLESFRKRDIRFDYYYFDAGWSNPHGDLTDFDPNHFPNGPDKVLERIRGMGMKAGLWTSPASGPGVFYPGVKDPRMAACGTLPERESGEREPYRGVLCMATDPWRSAYREALLHHVRVNQVSGFKLDGNSFCCSNPEHAHLPGKYSLEPIMDATIETLEAVRQECPDIMYMFYWSIQSPLWLLHGDTIYERGILMEGSTPADYPTRLLRQSITVSYDQATHHAWDRVPLSCGDSLGVWISKWRWANYIGKEGWQDAWVMDIARGSLLHQLWGDLSMFDAEDVDFLAYISAWVRKSDCLLRLPQRILGDPWKAEPYGYSYCDGDDGAVFVFNPTFEHTTIELRLGPELGLTATGDRQTVAIGGVYRTGHAVYEPDLYTFAVNETCRIPLEPFEVKVLELRLRSGSPAAVSPAAPAGTEAAPAFVASPFTETLREDIAWDDPLRQREIRRMLSGRALYVDSEQAFRSVRRRSDERDRSATRRIVEANVSISPFVGRRTLLVGASLSREGIYWHHHALFDIIHLQAVSNGNELAVRSTPHRWHEEAGGWSWILFEMALDGSDSAQTVALRLEAYLPRTVDMKADVWLYRD